MDGINVEVFGNKAILDNLSAFGEEIQAKAQAKLEESAEMAKELAYEYAPVSDINEAGYVHMRDQMYTDVQPGIATIGNDSDHAIYNEIGTSRMRAHPFLRPAQVQAAYWLRDELKGMLE